ncbi:MAG: pilus assembly FimT family protein [Gammaproteobacteria bacterium]
MPTSIRPAAGFTLLELVVVIAIVGVVLATITVAVPDSARADIELEAERLLDAIESCRRTAVLGGAPAGLGVDADGYRQLRYRGRWVAAGAGGERRIDDALAIDVQAAPRGGGTPAVLCLPSGETVLPVLGLAHRASGGRVEIRTDEDGEPFLRWSEPPA